MKAKANGIEIDYDETWPASGPDPSLPALVLIRGLGTQRIQWPQPLLDALAARGLRVVCHDNRDVGGSTKFDAAGVPDPAAMIQAIAAGETPAPPYRVADMAQDVIGLLDALSIERAHVAGISMGGMIVQHLGASHGDRIASVTSIMSSSGAPGLSPAKPEAMAALTSRAATPTREAVVENSLATQRVIGSPAYPADEDAYRELAGRVFDRCYAPDGVTRQMAAVLSDVGRHELIANVTVPTLVIHGEDDPLIPIDGGRDTAARIPGARFESIPGMGHDVPVELTGTLSQLIADHALAAEG